MQLLVLALVAAAAAWGAAAEPADPMFLLEEEADFVGKGDRLCQEALGLGFLLPPPGFKPNKDAQAKLVKTLREPGPSAFGWVFLNEERAQLILVEMVKGPRTAQDFLFFADKVEEGFGKATNFQLEGRDAKTEKAPYSYILAATLGENAFDISCISTNPGHPDPAVACIVTFAADHQALAKVRESFKFDGCK